MKKVAETGQGPGKQMRSVGCSIKGNTASRSARSISGMDGRRDERSAHRGGLGRQFVCRWVALRIANLSAYRWLAPSDLVRPKKLPALVGGTCNGASINRRSRRSVPCGDGRHIIPAADFQRDTRPFRRRARRRRALVGLPRPATVQGCASPARRRRGGSR
jgi:hypothetical protein